MVEHFPALNLFQRRQSEAEIVAVKKSGQAKSHEGMAVAREKLNQTVGQVFHKLLLLTYLRCYIQLVDNSLVVLLAEDTLSRWNWSSLSVALFWGTEVLILCQLEKV